MTLHHYQKKILLAAGVLIGALLLLNAILWLHRPVYVDRHDVSPFENDMVEALVRELLREDALRDASVCFLAFGDNGASPGADFIQRFADCRHPAVVALKTSVTSPVDRVFEKNTGRPGLVLKIIAIREVFSGNYDITISLSTLPGGHDRVIYRVYNVGGDWLVKKPS